MPAKRREVKRRRSDSVAAVAAQAVIEPRRSERPKVAPRQKDPAKDVWVRYQLSFSKKRRPKMRWVSDFLSTEFMIRPNTIIGHNESEVRYRAEQAIAIEIKEVLSGRIHDEVNTLDSYFSIHQSIWIEALREARLVIDRHSNLQPAAPTVISSTDSA